MFKQAPRQALLARNPTGHIRSAARVPPWRWNYVRDSGHQFHARKGAYLINVRDFKGQIAIEVVTLLLGLILRCD